MRQILKAETYTPVSVTNDDEFAVNVEKFDFDLFEYFRTNKITGMAQFKNYPLTLPFSGSVVQVNNLLEQCTEALLDYWQFLLSDITEFAQVTSSCERLLLAVFEQISAHVRAEVTSKFTTLQQAQVCTDLDYFSRSMTFY